MRNYVELSLKQNADKISMYDLGKMVEILALNVMGYEDYILHEMEEINDILFNRSVLEALQLAHSDFFDPYDDYFCMTDYYEFFSYRSIDDYLEMLMDKKDELIADIINESFHDDVLYEMIDSYLDWNGLLVEQSEGENDDA
mgnify:CR=1 FL=1